MEGQSLRSVIKPVNKLPMRKSHLHVSSSLFVSVCALIGFSVFKIITDLKYCKDGRDLSSGYSDDHIFLVQLHIMYVH